MNVTERTALYKKVTQEAIYGSQYHYLDEQQYRINPSKKTFTISQFNTGNLAKRISHFLLLPHFLPGWTVVDAWMTPENIRKFLHENGKHKWNAPEPSGQTKKKTCSQCSVTIEAHPGMLKHQDPFANTRPG